MAFHCFVIGCSNGSYRLERWKAAHCEKHGVRHDSDLCDCPPPFSLHPLPTQRRKPEERSKWLRMINRADAAAPGKEKLLSPKKAGRVCGKHFKDGKPTEENPYPTEELGYPGFREKVTRILRFDPSPGPTCRKKARQRLTLEEPPPLPPSEQAAAMEYDDEDTMDAPETSGVPPDDVSRENSLLLWFLSVCGVLLLFIWKARRFCQMYSHSLVAIVKLSKENIDLKKSVQDLQAENTKLKNQIQNLKKKRIAEKS